MNRKSLFFSSLIALLFCCFITDLQAQTKKSREQLEREKEQQASAAANAEITRNQRRRQAGLYQGLGATLGPSGQSLGRSIRPSGGRSSLLTGSKGGIGYRSRF